jgi:hypothetical protein
MENKKSNLPQHLQLDTVSPATRLLEKRRQMYEVQEAFEVQKKEFEKKEDNFKKKEEDLRKRDLEIQKALISFNKFLQDNEQKKTRADKRYLEEKKTNEQKEKEITSLKNEIEKANSDNKKNKVKEEQMIKYRNYIEDAIKNRDEFANNEQLLERYKILDKTNTELTRKSKELENL